MHSNILTPRRLPHYSRHEVNQALMQCPYRVVVDRWEIAAQFGGFATRRLLAFQYDGKRIGTAVYSDAGTWHAAAGDPLSVAFVRRHFPLVPGGFRGTAADVICRVLFSRETMAPSMAADWRSAS